MLRFTAAILVLSLSLSAGSELRQHSASSRGGAKFWPFTSAATEAAPNPEPAKKDVRPAIEGAKDAVLMSATFGRKTAQLCQDAPDEQRKLCRQMAGQRLFCALLQRHARKYDGMSGVAEERAKCDRIDIMVNSVEAAKDVQLERDANAD
eukprot:CAMPEP_0172712942 /NCGR_PEP_ID=MMETSP1074-20121228/61393_1 /TAXON_ID=2916 /ORGANISM="Ceratium fusus, Strain PA161109" /LENGTH=149 /DNA_ID=CAMNT_0013536947 /DNA_START=64 /DNA_END=513 /DNA_ORIENTATION=-